MKRLRIIVEGRVQGVGFRWFAKETAKRYELTGSVKNKMDGTVEIHAQGEEKSLENYKKKIEQGPNTFAKVENIRFSEEPLQEEETDFEVILL
ncbi:MAG TPA: acylphosphatase [Eubacteriaceae bacterium]|nr:acylphosphatase [Eubacteriaceae bacterium]